MSTDECRRRGRRTGAADSKAAAAAAAAAAAETTAAATAYRSSNGDPQQQQRSQAAAPSFPSVCRLIEKYTMLIERHRQQQEVMTPSARKKPSSSSAAATNVGKVSGEPSAQDVSSSKSSDPFGEEAAAWNRLLMDREDEDDCNGDDEPSDDAENYRRPREQRPVPSSQEQHGEHRHPSLLRFGCKSLGNVLQHGSGDEEDSSKLTDDDPYEENVAVQSGDEERRRAQQLPVVCRLEVSKTAKVKRKRRKSWTGPTGGGRSQGHGDGGGPSRKGHSLDQGYDTVHHTRHHHHHHHHQQDFGLHHHHHYSALFRSYSNNNGGDATATAAATDSGVPGSRQFRTPSVVVSDHSEDPVSFSSMFTLDDLDELEARPDCAFNDSSSDCSAASTWSAAGSVISVLDAEYSLHTPERKISECSTCSTFGGADEDADEEQAAFRLSKLKPKVSGTSLWSIQYAVDELRNKIVA